MVKTVIRKIIILLAILLILGGLYILYQVFAPEIEYRIDKPDEAKIIQQVEKQETYTENKLVIPAVGVDMIIGTDKQSLDNGGWVQRLSSDSLPNLIAIHRFGWSNLSAEQKMKQTLYHVYKLREGDVVFVIWSGKKYEFTVKNIIESTDNPANDEDLVIYTCKFFNSSQRVFIILNNNSVF